LSNSFWFSKKTGKTAVFFQKTHTILHSILRTAYCSYNTAPSLAYTVMQVVAKLISENWVKITEKWSKKAFSEHCLVNWTSF